MKTFRKIGLYWCYVGVEVYEDCILGISCVPIVTVQSIAMPYDVSVCV